MTSRQEAAQLFAAAFKLQQSNRLNEAEAMYRRALERDKRHADAAHHLGLLLSQSARHAEAIELLRRAVNLDATQPHYYANMVEPLHRAGDSSGAIEAARRAVQMSPRSADNAYLLGVALHAADRFAEAVEAYRRAITLVLSHRAAHNNLSNALSRMGRLSEAAEMAERALRLAPNSSEMHMNIALALLKVGQQSAAVDHARRAVQLKPHDLPAQNALLVSMIHDPNTTDEQLFDAHVAWGNDFAPFTASVQFANDKDPSRRIRVGYVSADFREHPVAFFIEPVIAHATDAVEVFCYSNAHPDDADATTARFRSYGPHWREIHGMRDEDASRLIREDHIDILVDLSGHTQRTRLTLFAHHPAPIQVAYLGYQATSGARAMEHRLTDALVDPPGLTDRYHTEKLRRLNVFACYRPPDDAPAVASSPCVKNGYVTFGAFTRPEKISPITMDLWAGALKRVADAKLIVFASAVDDAATAERFREPLIERGVDATRIEFVGAQPFAEYLQSHARVDVLLDTFPFNAHTTTCHALWMGVPTITFAGTRYASRMGLAVMTHLGMPELVGHSLEEFAEIAAKEAGNLERIAQRRATLRQRFVASKLMDGVRFTADLESHYREMFQAWCRQPTGEIAR